MKKEKEYFGLYVYDWMVIIIAVLIIICTILSIKLYKKTGIEEVLIENIQSSENEKILQSKINEHFNIIVDLRKHNDSLIKANENIDKRRKINYKNYQNELQRNKRINTVSGANIVIDSILRANGYR